MTLIINNKEVEQVLTMEDTIAALGQTYLQLATQEAAAIAIRMKSDMAT